MICETAITSSSVNITFLKAGPCKHWLNKDRELWDTVEFSSHFFDFLVCALPAANAEPTLYFEAYLLIQNISFMPIIFTILYSNVRVHHQKPACSRQMWLSAASVGALLYISCTCALCTWMLQQHEVIFVLGMTCSEPSPCSSFPYSLLRESFLNANKTQLYLIKSPSIYLYCKARAKYILWDTKQSLYSAS